MSGQRTRALAERIRQGLNKLTPTERRAARVLLADYPVAGLETVARFAHRAGVSGPTILRLVAKLGCTGYADFQRRLRGELQARLQSPLNRVPERETTTAEGDFLAHFCAVVCANARESICELPRADFDAVVRLLGDFRRPCHLLGGRFSAAVAEYFYRHLHVIRPKVYRITGQSEAWKEYLLDMRRGDLLVVFDIRRYQPDVIAFTLDAAARGVTVVLFTDQWLSPIAQVARHVFPVRIEAPSSWDSAVATVALVEALLSALTRSRRTEFEQRITAIEGLRDKHLET